jgi:hypothetical protein
MAKADNVPAPNKKKGQFIYESDEKKKNQHHFLGALDVICTPDTLVTHGPGHKWSSDGGAF